MVHLIYLPLSDAPSSGVVLTLTFDGTVGAVIVAGTGVLLFCTGRVAAAACGTTGNCGVVCLS